jgi:hypothetical protein
LGNFLLGAVFRKLHFWITFFDDKSCALIFAKIGWATFWAIESQTHLVTLSAMFSSSQEGEIQYQTNKWNVKLPKFFCGKTHFFCSQGTDIEWLGYFACPAGLLRCL